MQSCELVTYVTAIACTISKCCPKEELPVLAAIFTQLSDTLVTIIAQDLALVGAAETLASTREARDLAVARAARDLARAGETQDSARDNDVQNLVRGEDVGV
jgi:hypothetical protein